ncbi:MAG: CARDB domain-containing protein [candidate division Zixibacteria bacterium]
MTRRIIVGALFLGAMFLFSSAINAESSALYKYTVKFICGKEGGKILAPGAYWTAINVLNANDSTALYRKKFAIALPGEKPGPATDFFKSELPPGTAMEIDCDDIRNHTRSREDFIKGFVILESMVKLDIVAVYSVADLNGEVKSIDIERVWAQTSEESRCPDLIVEKIEKPIFDEKNKGTIVRVTIKNIGNSTAGSSIARAMDKIAPQNNNAIAITPALGPGQSVQVVFYLSDWVFKPNAIIEVMADYKNMIPECKEDNNTKEFRGVG